MRMIIGIPKEIKKGEFRVAATPAGVKSLSKGGHKVFVEKGAGEGSGFSDEEFRAVGAEIIEEKSKLFDDAELILKVKEPLPEEYRLFHEGQILFTFLHLAADKALTEALLKSEILGIAYETVNVIIVMSNSYNLEKILPNTDLLIGAVLVPGAKAPHLVTRKMFQLMKPGSVIVDVAVDQGGCAETTHPTTQDNPVFEVDGILHYCVANMPGAYPKTSTLALTNATLPYVLDIANKGCRKALRESPSLARGLNVYQGRIVYQKVARTHGLPWVKVEEILN